MVRVFKSWLHWHGKNWHGGFNSHTQVARWRYEKCVDWTYTYYTFWRFFLSIDRREEWRSLMSNYVNEDHQSPVENASGKAAHTEAELRDTVVPPAAFAEGGLGKHSEGPIRLGIGVNGGTVYLDLGKPVTWLRFGPDFAEALAAALIEHAKHAREAATRNEKPKSQP